jgi:hypothetical protein
MKQQKDISNEPLNTDDALPSSAMPKISKIIFDEKTGTITLKIATEEEIEQAEKERGSA